MKKKQPIEFCEDSGAASFCEPSENDQRQRPISHYRDAIADHFVEFLKWLDIRPLWRDGDTRYFRVNFWKYGASVGRAQITRSVFLAVDDKFDGLSVREIG